VRAATSVAAWAAMLAVLTALQFLFSDLDWLTPVLLGTAAFGTLALAALVAVRGERGGSRASPELSFATVAVAGGVAAMVIGAELGPWLVYLGAGVTLFGLGGLVRERRAERSDAAPGGGDA
jgi:hypothetical protein